MRESSIKYAYIMASIPAFKTEEEYNIWVADYADRALITPGMVSSHQLGEMLRLQPNESIYTAFPRLANAGLWRWPPRPPRFIP